jgi:DNA polymerase III subunit delta'
MVQTAILPWHKTEWELLQNRKNKLPHALLLTGPQGVGKHHFALELAKSLLCGSPKEDGSACNNCRHCQLIAAGTHPDWVALYPEEKGKMIKIDQVRKLVSFVAQTAQLADYKIVIIEPADAMNNNAANALLKTLEEPAQKTLLVLITNRLMTLPATVRSRCQIIHFPVPETTVAKDWLLAQEVMPGDQLFLLLAWAHGAPLRVLDLIKNDELVFREEIFQQWCDFRYGKLSVVKLAEKWSKLDLIRILNHLRLWIMDLIYIKQINDNAVINQDIVKALTEIAATYELQKLHQFYAELNNTIHLIQGPFNLNPQLLLEGLLI